MHASSLYFIASSYSTIIMRATHMNWCLMVIKVQIIILLTLINVADTYSSLRSLSLFIWKCVVKLEALFLLKL